jgi:hypothetical protein
VLVLLDAELLDAPADLLAIDLRGEGGLLQLLANRLRPKPLDPGGPDPRARRDEAGQLIDREERLGQPGRARNVQVLGVAGDGFHEVLGVAPVAELDERHPRVPGLRVGVALVVEVVNQPRDPPELLVLVVAPRVGAHRGLDPQHVLSQRLGGDPLANQVPGIITRRLIHAPLLP